MSDRFAIPRTGESDPELALIATQVLTPCKWKADIVLDQHFNYPIRAAHQARQVLAAQLLDIGVPTYDMPGVRLSIPYR